MNRRRGAPLFPALMNDCVLWWPGLETTEFPIIPSGVTVTPNGMFTKTDLGNNKQVVNFDGTNSNNIIFGTLGTNFAFGTDPMSMCFWFKVSGSTTHAILSRYTTWDTDLDFYIYFDSSTQYFTYHVLPSTTSPYTISTTTQTPATDWVHVAFVKGNGGVYTSYLNGVYQESITNTTAQTNNKSTISMGFGVTTGMVKVLKDLFIFKGRALSLGDIKFLMNRTHPITGRDLLPGGYDYYKG